MQNHETVYMRLIYTYTEFMSKGITQQYVICKIRVWNGIIAKKYVAN